MILTMLGEPKKLVDLLRALHNDFKVKFTVDDVISMIASVIAVKQSDIFGPILFTFFIAALMTTWKTTNNVTVCIFYSKNDTKLTGCSYRVRGENVLLRDSEYAHDTAILLDNHEELTNDVNSIVTQFARF